MNQSLLIADDEVLIRQGLIARLHYLDMIPSKVYEASNGALALEILKKEEPDIVITDIQMPDMDGLNFIKKAKEFSPKTKFIILSGYAEFAYAEQAIQLGVNAYLLKPISNENLKQSMQDVIEKIQADASMKRELQEGNRSKEEKKAYDFVKNMNDLLQNSHTEKEIQMVYEDVNRIFYVKNRRIMLAIIHIDGDTYEDNQFSYRDIELIRFSIKNVLNELVINCDKTAVDNLTNRNEIFLVFSAQLDKEIRKETEQAITQLQNVCWQKMKVSMTVGISSILDGAAGRLSKQCTEEAEEALSQRMIHGTSQLYFYDDIKLLSANEFPTSSLNMLKQYIERGDVGNIEFLIQDIFSDDQVRQYNAAYIRIMWIRIIGILLKSANTIFHENPRKAEKIFLNFDVLNQFENLEDLRYYFNSIILEAINSDGGGDVHSKDKIKKAARYIKDNYNKDIAINELAEKYKMSPNYFSSIFKKEMGSTTVNYIKDLRIERAKDCLALSNKSVVDIAKEVGYDDSQYFFRVFKKATGLTPLQYRRQNTELL